MAFFIRDSNEQSNEQAKKDFIKFIIDNCFDHNDTETTERVKKIILRIFRNNPFQIEINEFSETFKMIIRFIKDLYLTPNQSQKDNQSVTINKTFVVHQYVKYFSVNDNQFYAFMVKEDGHEQEITDDELLAELEESSPTWENITFPSTQSNQPSAPPNSPNFRF